MVTQERERKNPAAVKFAGNAEERKLAERIVGLARARGRFMSADAPIRVSLESIAEFLRGQDDAAAAERLEAAVAANPNVFAVEEIDGQRVLVTTRAGRAPVTRAVSIGHSFAQRFMTPLPKPERPPQPVRERARVDPSWATLPAVLGDYGFEEEFDPAEFEPAVVEPETPPVVAVVERAAVVEPPIAPPPLQERVVTPPPVIEPTRPAVAPTPLRPVPASVVPPPPSPAPVPVVAEAIPVVAPPVVAPTIEVPAPVAPAPAPAEVAAVAVAPTPAAPVPVAPTPVPAPPPARPVAVPVVPSTDVSGIDDADLAAMIRQRLGADPRVAQFGEQWAMEDRVPRFSRGDLRRIKDYLQEQEQPSTDIDLVQDVLGIRPNTPDFETMRFAVNVRLSREHREFEFVGSTDQRFWSTAGLPQIGTTRRKPNEVGTDYRYLLDEAGEAAPARSAQSVDHVLTFYEYVHGLLPFDAELQALLPAPLLPNQRAAVLTFESPQSYTTYLVELRYPTPNRGGFVLGLDDLFAENLVPGAIVSIQRTDNDGHYLIEYLAESGQNARLLELDERRAQRYVFRPTTYACGVDDTLLLTEERFGRLNGEKPLDDKVRRRPEAVVAATFERVGSDSGGNFSAEFRTLLAGVNIERPISPTLLRSILEHDDTGAFSRDPDGTDVYTYVPGSTP